MIENLVALFVGTAALAAFSWAAVRAARRARLRTMTGPERRAGGHTVLKVDAARPAVTSPRPRALDSSEIQLYQVTGLAGPPNRYVGIVCGDLRRVRCADVWVNSENTEMLMARFDEFSVSSIIRYEGARRDDVGRVVDDCIAEELARKVAGRRPVPPGTAITTGSGALSRSNVRHIVHVAAVQGEPGAGFRQAREVGRCVTSVMAEVDAIDARPAPETILFPLLGMGQGGGDLKPTISSLVGAAVDYFGTTPRTRITTVFFLAYTDVELAACEAFFADNRWVRAADPGPATAPALPPPPAEAIAARQAPHVPPWKKLRMGFVLDVVGYGARPALSQESVQHRLPLLVDQALRGCGAASGTVNLQWTGDGVNVVLPSDIDPTTALPDLIRSITRHLAAENRGSDDRIRLRMAVGAGIVGQSAIGFAGSMIVDINRLVDSALLRSAVVEHPDSDLVVLVSDHVYSYIIRPGYPGLPIAEFRPVDVAVKEFNERAWLWISHPDPPDAEHSADPVLRRAPGGDRRVQ
jgi:O-acetyl-ADP-ribose deacetylase (regulator of RNase III)